MLSYEDRISAIVKQIQSLKDANKQLERERDLLENQVTELKTQQLAFKKEKNVFEEEQREEQKRKVGEEEMSMSSVELKQEINRHIESIDECLDLLKTI